MLLAAWVSTVLTIQSWVWLGALSYGNGHLAYEVYKADYSSLVLFFRSKDHRQ